MPSQPPTAPPVPSIAGSLEEAKERYESTKRNLRSGLAKKRLVDRTLTDLESQIYLFEGSYLAATAASGGNILKGFDGYLKGASGGSSSKTSNAAAAAAAAAAARATPGAVDVPLEDRMFSSSSSTFQRSLELKANESRATSPSVSRPPGSASKKGGGGDSSAASNGAARSGTPSKEGGSAAAAAAAATTSSVGGSTSTPKAGSKKRKDPPGGSGGGKATTGLTKSSKKKREED